MGFVEIALIVLLVLAILLVAAAAYFLFRPKRLDGAKDEIARLAKDTQDGIAGLRQAVTESIYHSIITFNEKVNLKLSDNADKSAGNIADFRVNVNKELAEFQEKIGTKLNAEFKAMADTVEKQMGAINTKVEDRLSQGFRSTNETFLQIAERVKVIDEAQKKIESLSTDMMSLQQILTNNQTRGSFGEFQLNQILSNVFGADNRTLFDTQVTLKEAKGKSEGVRVDAVVFMPGSNGGSAMLPIDSKFPFSEYSKLFDNKTLSREEEEKTIQLFGANVKKHITAIASKYIIPGITTDYALMFVASDGILALIHSHMQNVVEYAREKRITIVSPTTLIPLLASYRAVKIDFERTKYSTQIQKELNLLEKEFARFDEDWNKLSENIQKLSKQSGEVNSHVQKISNKFSQIKNVDIPEERAPEAPRIEERTEQSD
ncbi:MAG TPA: hypothetical protein DCR44_07385 [Acholeplasmatales bacterium]|nr:MAG: hypothetical protein A2Y16_02245 [Tenericutes bacterium GWF2_57_13]HAQ57197.1 hypothetical protein [Acholeplasmatales bacterium]